MLAGKRRGKSDQKRTSISLWLHSFVKTCTSVEEGQMYGLFKRKYFMDGPPMLLNFSLAFFFFLIMCCFIICYLSTYSCRVLILMNIFGKFFSKRSHLKDTTTEIFWGVGRRPSVPEGLWEYVSSDYKVTCLASFCYIFQYIVCLK